MDSWGGPATGPSFSSQLRHEVRTQLNHVLGYAELLLDSAGGSGTDAYTDALEAVIGAGERAVAAVEELLHPSALDRPAALAVVQRALGEIAAHTEAVLAGAPGDDTRDDLLRVEAAARTALALVEEPDLLSRLGHIPPPAAVAGLIAAPLSLAEPRRERSAPMPLDQPQERGPWAEGRTILVVDDDDANREVLSRRLKRLGYHVTTAADGQQGLDVLRGEGADLVLLDLMMPVLNGYEVLEACRADETLRDVPIIMISARDDIDDVVECISLGAEDFLPKPFDPVLLDARVGACLEKKWLRDQERALLVKVREQAETLAQWNAGLEVRVRDQVAEIARLARLRRFLSPQVADVIVSSGVEKILDSHRSRIAVLFCDLRGFTAFAETVEPEDVMAVIGEYHAAIGSLVSESNATVGFFSGDGLMVFFNDPIPCDDPAERAVRLAVNMRGRMTTLCSTWRRRGYDVGFGIGVTFGYATLGEIGFEGRSDYGVIGSVVNLAARLCDQAANGQILVSAPAHRAVEDLVEAEELGPMTLKGFSSPVPAFNVVGLRERAG